MSKKNEVALDDFSLAKRKLKRIVLGFFVGLMVPMFFLLSYSLKRVQEQAYFRDNSTAQELFSQINHRLEDLIKLEEKRSFDDYSYLKIRNIKPTKIVQMSPLASIIPKTPLPGVIGYFQFSPDGSFSSPVFPKRQVLQEFPRIGLSRKEYELRKSIRDHLYSILDSNDVFPSLTNQQAFSRSVFDESFFEESSILGNIHFLKNKKKATSTSKEEKDKNFNSFSMFKSSFTGVSSSEIGPLQAMLLETGELLFHRKIWKNQQRFIQGFLIDQDDFFDSLVKSSFQKSTLSKNHIFRINYKDVPIRQYRQENNNFLFDDLELLTIGNSSLPFPLADFDLVIKASEINPGPGHTLVWVLGLILTLVLVGGLLGIYRLAFSQINLAQQQRNFVSAVSHELKTPLTSIRMYGEMLRSGWVQDKSKLNSYYDFIFFESERLSRLIANVLQMAKFNTSNSKFELDLLPPSSVLSEMIAKTKNIIELAGFELELEKPQGAEKDERLISVDLDSLSQTFINLVDNALKFSKHAEIKKIKIGYRFSSNNKEVVFFVRDFGPGIAKDQQKKIFKLFYRAENELTRTTPGTGIGLSLVVELLKPMNAKIELGNPDLGAEFKVRFPLKKENLS